MSNIDVRRFYETFDFEGMITNPPKLIQDFLDGEIDFIKKHINGKSILEIGCGYGRLLKIMKMKNKRIVGIDFSQRMVDLAKKNVENVEIYQMNANKLNFESGEFDEVVCLDNSFGNMPGIELDALQEMTRVCKKGGEIIISVFSENARDVQIENYKRIGLKEVRDDGDAIKTKEGFYSRRFKKEELEELFRKCGLKCNINKICPVNYIAYAIKH